MVTTPAIGPKKSAKAKSSQPKTATKRTNKTATAIVKSLPRPEPDYDANPLPPEAFDEIPEGFELVDGTPLEKTGMTIRHAETQGNLAFAWTQYAKTTKHGGKAYPEAPCQTLKQKRRPDVVYVTPAFQKQYGKPSILPIPAPLIAEIASPDDSAEMLFAKAQEYLEAGAEEVWILLPEMQLAFIVLPQAVIAFMPHQTIATQKVLPGFSIPLAELFS
jgi:Uma2 family endonuclease